MTDKAPVPTMLYRHGDSPNPAAWNRKLDTTIVGSDEVEVAQADGWFLIADLPDEPPAKKPPKAADPAPPAKA